VFTGLAMVAITLMVALLAPSFSALILALTLTVVFRPLYGFMLRATKGIKGLASFITVILSALIILLPLSLFAWQIFIETEGLYDTISKAATPWGKSYDPLFKATKFLPDILEKKMASYMTTNEVVTKVAEWAVKNVGNIFSNLSSIALTVFVALIGMYYFLKDGHKFRQNLINLSPLTPQHTRLIMNDVQVMVFSVVRGSLVVAFIQGLLAGVGFYIFGVPSPVLWGAVSILAALFPMIGTGIVVVPAVIYLFSQQMTPQAIGLTAWGFLLVGTIDNLIRPLLIRRGNQLHPFLILLSVIGGLVVLGPIGFLAGPLILAFFFSLITIYSETVARPPEPDD